MPRIKDQALCLRHHDWSETSQLVDLFTQAHGKIRGLAKGSKRMSPSSVARYSGGIELLTLGQVVAIVKPSSTLATITEWDLEDPHWALHRDLRAQELAFYAADVTNAMLAAELDPHPTLYTGLVNLLRELTQARVAQGGEAARLEVLLRYQWLLLMEAGYRPELDRDVVTGEELTDEQLLAFDAQRGGMRQLHPEQAGAGGGGPEWSGPWRIRAGTVQLLRSIAAATPAPPAEIDTLARANRLLCVYIRALLDRELPTMRVLLAAAR